MNTGVPLFIGNTRGVFLDSGGRVYLGVHVVPPVFPDHGIALYRLQDRDIQEVLTYEGVALPETREGLVFLPPGQALPALTMFGDCVILTDGRTPLFPLHDLRSSQVDTLEVLNPPPPSEPPRAEALDEAMRDVARIAPVRVPEELPPPTARWSAMVVDPDAHLWLRTARSAIGDGWIEVVRVPLQGGVAEYDTVPAFPVVFGEPGEFLAVERDPDTGVPSVAKYELKER